MKILFLTTAFNGMAQRAWIALDRLNHQVRVQIASDEKAMTEAVAEFQPDLIIAPFLKKKIPESIWKDHVCLIIHPGIPGDRGASSLDWAILNDEKEWGVTLLQAAEKMDAGAIWATRNFPMRRASKACIYRHEVTQAAMQCLVEAIENFQNPAFSPTPLNTDPKIRGRWNRSTQLSDYQFSWTDPMQDILKKINAADSDPGAPVELSGNRFLAFGAHLEENLKGEPGVIIAKRAGAICIAAKENAVWITHLKELTKESIKLPAALVLGSLADRVPEMELGPFDQPAGATFQEIRFRQEGAVGYLYFDFYNGAMSTDQCERLRRAIAEAKQRPIKVLALMGGADVWSNGIHLNIIESSETPEDESWRNINAIDDLILEIIESPDHYVIAALHGNAGAGGVPFALAADKILARDGIVLNPHTANMGLYGSEYWTYLLPRRIGTVKAQQFTEQCLPWGTAVAKEIGLIDDVFETTAEAFGDRVKAMAQEIASLPYFDKLLMAKRFQRKKDERVKPLAQYREEELTQMKRNFYDNDLGYDEKRFRFVYKIYDAQQSQSVEEKDWYSSRRKIYRRRKWESIEYK